MPKWINKAKRLRSRGMPSSSIAAEIGIAPQTLWAALKRDEDPAFRRREQKKWRSYKKRRRKDPNRVIGLKAYEKAESARRYKDPKYRKEQQRRSRKH